jgi:glutamyl-tRNA synthetase
MGLTWDEGPDIGGKYGPYNQSERLNLYNTIAEKLLSTNMAYKCYCTTERLQKLRETQTKNKQQIGYDGYCKNISSNQKTNLENLKFVLRFRVPQSGITSLTDSIHGTKTFPNKLIDDFILIKTDGYPTYHFANVVDDHYMEITHVLRADEWLSSTPKHLLIYESLGWKPPTYVHLPIILGSDKSRLSKRHGATSILAYKDEGFLPDAMLNSLSLLGWSLDDKTTIISRKELTEKFELNQISKAPSTFDIEKLKWINSQYIRTTDNRKLNSTLYGFLETNYKKKFNDYPFTLEYLSQITPLIKERINTLNEVDNWINFFFHDCRDYTIEELIPKNMTLENSILLLKQSILTLQNTTPFNAESINNNLRNQAISTNITIRQLLGSLRMAITAQKVAPPLFETIEILSKSRTIKLIEKAINFLEKSVNK